jgi:hypothetical protein
LRRLISGIDDGHGQCPAHSRPYLQANFSGQVFRNRKPGARAIAESDTEIAGSLEKSRRYSNSAKTN